MQAACLGPHVEQMFDCLDEVDGAEDVPLDELVGTQGPVFHLVKNVFTVSRKFFVCYLFITMLMVVSLFSYMKNGLCWPRLNLSYGNMLPCHAELSYI